ncbi:oligosaccharide repeat unit polymerase [Halomonas shengliensis]|uniref:Oligosaccharide repeat unit polymerase n=1 Tax=Halomonas shengliensis TaxID=419597 RepID=A0A1H0L4T3_9GAMM|nr:oligosaccharide repeat unit polymerase [Halomonas shengliensis]SDO63237.1 oligosaccharide repeat unit polymerase [Halomonas shengliensis]
MTILFLLVWAATLFIFIFITKATKLTIGKISEIQIFLSLTVLMSFLGYPILYFKLDDYRVMTGITDIKIIVTAMLAASWSLIGAILAYGILDSISRKKRFLNYPVKDEENENINALTPIFLFWSLIFSVVLFVTYVYISKIDSLAILESLSGKSVAQSRSNMTNNFSGSYHWYSLFFYDLSWVCSLALYALALTYRSVFGWFLFSIFFLCTSFFLTMTAQKAPFVFFLATIFLVHSYLRSGKMLSTAKMLSMSLVSLAAVLIMYILFMGSGSFISALSSTASRALTGQLSGAYNYLWIFPEKVDYLLGRSFPNPSGIFPFDHYQITTEVMKIVNPHFAERGVVGSQPTMYWGEAYANFGWVGVLVAPLYVGAYFFFWKWCIGFIVRPHIKAVATVWIGLQLGRFAFSGFSWSMFPVTLVAGFLLLITADRLSKANIKYSHF